VLVHEDDPLDVEAVEVRSARSDHRSEPALGSVDHRRSALPCLLRTKRIGLDDDDLPPRELERPRVDSREAELEHAAGAFAQQLEDPRRSGGGQSGWKSVHRYARYMSKRRTGKYLGVPYDWRRPTMARVKARWWNRRDRRIFTPKSYGWGYDVNFYEVARRLGLKH
jgi:hypothetical protein